MTMHTLAKALVKGVHLSSYASHYAAFALPALQVARKRFRQFVLLDWWVQGIWHVSDLPLSEQEERDREDPVRDWWEM